MLAISSLALIAASFQTVETVPHSDLIIEARDISRAIGNSVWPGLSEAPETVLLIAGETEYLICHPSPVEGFAQQPSLDLDGCSVQTRGRVFPPALLASFPAVDGTPTIVVGTPDATGMTSRDWMRTLLHEHFHQWETAPADAYQRAIDLDLHGGDQTGMWMLNYPFPYTDSGHAERATLMAERAIFALQNRGSVGFSAAVQAYLDARSAFLDALPAEDARYYEFQVRKEGVARWSELGLLRALDDHTYADAIEAQDNRLISSLENLDLTRQQRVAFYAFGAAEAELLEHLAPDWKQAYLDGPLELGVHFTNAINPESSPGASSD